MINADQKTILLVEDDAIVALAETMTLEEYGYKVITAYTGEKAVEVVETNTDINLVLMDINLGKGIDGTEAAEMIIAKKDLPLIFLSSHTEREIVEKTEGITSYGYIVKSAGETVLIASIKMAFRLFEARIKEKVKEKVLLDSEERYRLLFETMISGYALLEIIYDKKGNPLDCRYIDVNPSHEKLTGLKSKDIIGKTVRECIPNLEDSWIKNYASVDKTGIPITIENFVDGLKKWYRAYSYRPKPGYVAVTFEDITTYMLAAEEQRLVNEKYLDLYDNAPDMFVSVDAKTGIIIECNQTTERNLGYKKEEIIGRHIKEMYHPISETDSVKVFKQFVETGNVQNAELKVKKKDGAVIEVSLNVSAVQNEKGDVLYSRSSWRDITKHKQAEKALKDSENRYRTLFNTMIQGVIYQSESGQILSANKASEEILGLTFEKMKGRTSVDPRWKAIKKDGADFPGDEHPAMLALKTGQPVKNVIMGVFHPNQEKYRWISINAVPQFRQNNKKPYQVFTTFNDITELKQAEDSIKKAYDEKQVLLKELQHRVKNSFATIISLISLKARSTNVSETKNILDELSIRIKAISYLYNKLSETGTPNKISLHSYCLKVANSIINVSVNIKLQADLDEIEVNSKNATTIGLIIVELVTNAIKYAFTDDQAKTIYLTLKKNDKNLLLTIADNGGGIPEEFDHSQSGATGLMLVGMMVNQLDGEIKFESNQGTTVNITIPHND